MMKAAADGLPEVGTKFGMLGVRPKDPANPKKRFDVSAAAPTDTVSPGEGMSVDAEEALFGALDGLTGYCHPDSAYKDPPEPPVPSATPSAGAHTSPTTPKTT